MPDREHWEMEQSGYEKGYNPFFGEFKQTFNFAPVPYGHRKRNDFVTSLHREFANIKYIFWGEVKVYIQLYHNEQRRLETPELADLDNYAKIICDGIKGANGVLIDDSQIQTLSISWIDAPNLERFDIEIKGHPDEFILKPLSLFEMPDGLFYPVSSQQWSADGPQEDISDEQKNSFLSALYCIIYNKRGIQHEVRLQGMDTLNAYWRGRSLGPILYGFHKSRIIESRFDLKSISDWKKI